MGCDIKGPRYLQKTISGSNLIDKNKTKKNMSAKLFVTITVWVILGSFDGITAKNYYLQLTTKLNWYAAFEACAAQNQQLATINSASEEADLEKIMVAAGRQSEWMWTSGTDQAKVLSFVWMSTGQPFNYTKWTANEPDNLGGNELCVHVWPQNNAIGWNDWGCTNTLYYICEDKVCGNGNNGNNGNNNGCGCGQNGGNSGGIVTNLLKTLL